MSQISTIIKYKDYIRYSTRIQLFSRYSNLYLGIVWWFLDPLLLMSIYSFIFLVIFQVSTPNYLTFVLIGLIVWRWISGSITQSTSAISSKIGVMEQVAAPKQIFPFIDLLIDTLLFLAAFSLIIIALILDGISPSLHMLEVVPITIIVFIFLYGLGLVVAHYGAFVADLKPAFAYGLRFLFYLSPIFYPVTLLPENLQSVYQYNPIAIIVEGYRACLMYDSSPNYFGLLAILGLGVILMFVGLKLIEKHDKDYCKIK